VGFVVDLWAAPVGDDALFVGFGGREGRDGRLAFASFDGGVGSPDATSIDVESALTVIEKGLDDGVLDIGPMQGDEHDLGTRQDDEDRIPEGAEAAIGAVFSVAVFSWGHVSLPMRV
jgi:hypothetical protein